MRRKDGKRRQLFATTLLRATASSHYSRNERVRSRTGRRLGSRAFQSEPEAEREEVRGGGEALSSKRGAPGLGAKMTRGIDVPECTTGCFSTVSVVQASPLHTEKDCNCPQRRSWTAPELTPHGAPSVPAVSTTNALVVDVSPVTPHTYCTTGALTLRSSANARRTRVFTKVRESSLTGRWAS